MVTDASDHLATELLRIVDTPGRLSDAEARRFLESFPLPVLFGHLQSHLLDNRTEESACIALGRLFDTPAGAALLPECVPYAVAALESQQPVLRRLAAQQLGRILQQGDEDELDLTTVVQHLVRAMEDEDTSVAWCAREALNKFARQPEGFRLLTSAQGAGDYLSEMVESDDPVTRMRGLAMVAELAACSHDNLLQLQACGLLEPLLQELGNQEDALSCMNALQLLLDFLAAQPTASAAVLYEMAMPVVAGILAGGDAMLRGQALKVAGAFVGVLAAADEGAARLAGGAAGGALPLPGLLTALKRVLDTSSEEQPPVGEVEAALEAVAAAGATPAGASLLLGPLGRSVVADVATLALGRTAHVGVRLCALHALASLAASTGEARGSVGAGAAADAEAAFKDALYAGAAAGRPGASPASALAALLSRPFPDTSAAAYRLLEQLVARPWAAADAAAQAGLLSRLCATDSETTKQLCEWRFSALSALSRSAQRAVGGQLESGAAGQLQAVAARLAEAVGQGPFGAGRVVLQAHVVATMRR